MNYEAKALTYAEKHGVIDYSIKGCHMIYYKTYSTEGTYKHDVNLRTMEESIKPLKRRRKH